jgi:hypothetical protein
MFGLLSRSNAVCRRDRAIREIVLGAQKSPQIVLRKVVLSGFPTALEPTLPPPLPRTDTGTLPSDWRASRLPLPRDDIRPQVLGVALGVCRLRLARIYASSYPSSLLKGAVWEGQ